ncbi:sigma factor-like helix-turn-helix DNA-binding protein [Streptomyces sp. bgisy084]|uniref:sigma factor-like helix-turn-helix DNA-binding protein n=1 Tax=unclassified Streptomyces TaxID=2593676 RepID=UPI003D715473
MTQREQAATAFDDLHTRHAAALNQQAYLLTGRPWLARRAVERGFRLAWQRWPEVAVDPDPAGWVRAAVYEYALTPWHRLCPGLRTARGLREASAPGPSDRALPAALLSLPARYRRVLLLHDVVGLGPDETAAEIEASVPATTARLAHARERLAELLPELGLDGQSPVRQGEILRARITALPSVPPTAPSAAADVRGGSERSARRTTRAVFGGTGLFALVTLVMMALAPDHYTPQERPRAHAPHTRTAPARHHRDTEARDHRDTDARHHRDAARERGNAARNAAREQGNAAVRKKIRQARLAPELR